MAYSVSYTFSCTLKSSKSSFFLSKEKLFVWLFRIINRCSVKVSSPTESYSISCHTSSTPSFPLYPISYFRLGTIKDPLGVSNQDHLNTCFPYIYDISTHSSPTFSKAARFWLSISATIAFLIPLNFSLSIYFFSIVRGYSGIPSTLTCASFFPSLNIDRTDLSGI